MVETKSSWNVMSVEEVGERFLDYFHHLNYKIIPGSSLLDDSVPMSFVMSAGMVQFEKMSDGRRSGDHFALIQNCFRYFDLDLIGDSDTHLSLFQMPAAFDFGPVDRQRTVNQIWKLLTEVYGLVTDSLFVTYFSGGEIDGQILPPDIETAKAWQGTGLPMEHIIGLGGESNFWSQSSQVVGKAMSRKRGPNTEVFYDRGAEYGCRAACKPGCSCGRFVEFLNTLFITLKFDPQTCQLIPMDEPFTEIVIGRERLAMILERKTSVFEVNSIYPLIQQLRCFSKPLPVEIEGLEPPKFEKTFVDHLRALLFLTADGAPPPGKGGRPRLMRILVRELLTSQRLLGISDSGFLRSMVLTALELYPQLASARKRLLGYIAEENERFERTVQVGLYDLEAILQQSNQQLSGKDVLTLEKKHGLPLPLLRYRLWQKNVACTHLDGRSVRTRSGPKTPQGKSAPTFPEGSRKENDTNEVAQVFLDTYHGLGYNVLPGSSLLDDSIPMSFVMSAGLVQVERAITPLIRQGNNRFVLLQNCFRHFDLDRVGPSNTHISFFRMLGAFTFGPVNRLEQIHTAWDLATNTYRLPPENLWVTYFGGDTIAGKSFEPDLETYRAWREVGVREKQLLGLNREENFWKQSAMVMGPEHTSKCGPNSEIFFDRGEDLCCGPDCQPGCSCGRFVEFLNMLFITYSLDEESKQIYSLEMPFTESVVGMERMAMILQGADSIYDIDSIRPLMFQARRLSKINKLGEGLCLHYERILIDHIRALLFLVSDDAPSPGKGGRAFLMRRLVRELLVSLELLGIREPLCLSDLLDRAILLYRDSKPKISSAKHTLMDYIVDEKLHLEHTLESGFARIARMFVNQNVQWISGLDILDFKKEYGLPFPMLERFLNEKHIAYNPKAIKAAEELWKLDILETSVQVETTGRGMI
jgi:alanyl-tRNA synthetase